MDAGRAFFPAEPISTLPALTEQVQIQFQAEVFNVANRAIFANPNGLISASDFGRINLPLNTTPIEWARRASSSFC